MIAEASVGGVVIHDAADGAAVGLIDADLGSPAPREALAELAGDHGAADATALYHPRVINLRGEVWGDTWAEFWANVDALKGAFSLGALREFVFRREGLEFLERALVRVDSPLDLPLSDSVQYAEWGVSLLAPDPRVYTAAEHVAFYDLTSTDTGVTFPLGFPLVFTDGTPVERDLAITADGNFATPPRFVVVGPVTDPEIVHVGSGHKIVTRGVTLTAGDELHVDVRTRTVRLDAPTGPARADLIDPAETHWWHLEPGQNDVRLSGTGTDPGTTTLTVVWRDARI